MGRAGFVGCGRPCDHQRQAPAIPVVRDFAMQRQEPIFQKVVEVPQIQFFDRVVDFSVVSRDVFPQCKLCRRPARSHRWCSWTRLGRPLLYNDRCLGSDSAEHCGISAVAVLTRWSMSLFVQFIDGNGRPCDHAATSGLSLEVPQTQFVARVRGHSSCTTETGTMLSARRR